MLGIENISNICMTMLFSQILKYIKRINYVADDLILFKCIRLITVVKIKLYVSEINLYHVFLIISILFYPDQVGERTIV